MIKKEHKEEEKSKSNLFPHPEPLLSMFYT